MDEKIYGYLVNNSIAVEKCVESVDVCMKALVKQSKINRIQRAINGVLAFLVMTSVKNIINLNTIVKKQGDKIEELEASLNVEETKKHKGE